MTFGKARGIPETRECGKSNINPFTVYVVTKILKPLEQLFQLNREAYTKLDELSKPLIVVGGQAIGYWLKYYADMLDIRPEYTEAIYSVDIDYAAKLKDIQLINDEWNSQFLPTPEDHPPPSLAVIVL